MRVLKRILIAVVIAFTLCIGVVFALPTDGNDYFEFEGRIEAGYTPGWWIDPVVNQGPHTGYKKDDRLFYVGFGNNIEADVGGYTYQTDSWANGMYDSTFHLGVAYASSGNIAPRLNIDFGFINNTDYEWRYKSSSVVLDSPVANWVGSNAYYMIFALREGTVGIGTNLAAGAEGGLIVSTDLYNKGAKKLYAAQTGGTAFLAAFTSAPYLAPGGLVIPPDGDATASVRLYTGGNVGVGPWNRGNLNYTLIFEMWDKDGVYVRDVTLKFTVSLNHNNAVL